jgi:membrane-associated phospholipid phosphatase
MDAIKNNKGFLIILFLISAALIITGTFFDLYFSEMVYTENQWFSVTMEAICFIPIYLPFSLLFFLLSVRNGNKWLSHMFAGLSALCVAIALTVGFHYIHKRGLITWLTFPIYFPVIFLILMYVSERLRKRFLGMSEDVFSRLLIISLAGILYLLYELLVVHVIKAFAGRPRYAEILLDSTLYFAPWFDFTGQEGNSFPSGHTAQACGIMLLLLIPLMFPEKESRRPVYSVISILWILVTAFTRIILGKHFLSDTGFGILIMEIGLMLLFLFCEKMKKRIDGSAYFHL